MDWWTARGVAHGVKTLRESADLPVGLVHKGACYIADC